MYFEFEITNSSDVEAPQFANSKSAPSEDDKQMLSLDRCSSSPTSPLAQRKSSFGSTSSLSNHSSTPINRSHFMSSLMLPSTSPISSQRYRRYSIHSSPVTLDTLHDNGNATFCDLALITKKKLLQINCKALDEINEPDVKLIQSFCKPSNKDLRREVLLASIQRSLSVSSDDLSLSPSSSKMSELNESDPFKSMMDKSNDIDTDDLPMEIMPGNAAKAMFLASTKTLPPCSISADEIMSEFDPKSRSPGFSRICARRRLASYTPIENQNNYMSSQTTFTSTTSMAGGGRNGVSHCRGFMKKLNVNTLNHTLGDGIGNNGNYYSTSYYSNSATPNKGTELTMTMSSSLNTPLKKRLFSPSKCSSPYHTTANSMNCKDFNVIFSNSTNNLLSPDWDVTFKRLKVMHCNGETNPIEAGGIDHTENNQLSLLQLGPNNGQPEHELNELAQDFHRLKTPFT